jgi:hypothetical protein
MGTKFRARSALRTQNFNTAVRERDKGHMVIQLTTNTAIRKMR